MESLDSDILCISTDIQAISLSIVLYLSPMICYAVFTISLPRSIRWAKSRARPRSTAIQYIPRRNTKFAVGIGVAIIAAALLTLMVTRAPRETLVSFGSLDIAICVGAHSLVSSGLPTSLRDAYCSM